METGRNKITVKPIRFYSRFYITVFGVLLLTSCQTGKPVKLLGDEGLMYAMIYDQTNSPVSGVAVYINNKKTVDSDIQGRFVLESMKKGIYKILLVKKGYENLEEEFQYTPMQVLYFKMINSAGLVELAENAMDNNDLSAAENALDRALAIEPNRPDIVFLKCIVYYLQGRYNAAAEILEGLKSGTTDQSVTRLLENIRLIKDNDGGFQH